MHPEPTQGAPERHTCVKGVVTDYDQAGDAGQYVSDLTHSKEESNGLVQRLNYKTG